MGEAVVQLRRRFRADRKLLLGAAMTAFFLGVAAVSFFWTPHSVTAIEISERFQGSSWGNWLGTDHFGRDLFSMIMVGAANSLVVALVAVGIGAGRWGPWLPRGGAWSTSWSCASATSPLPFRRCSRR